MLYIEKKQKYLVLPAIIAILIIAIYPILFQIYLSLHRYALGFDWSTRLYIGIKNYINILNSPSFLNSLKLTLIFTMMVTILSLLIGMSIALIINREFKSKSLIITSILIPQSISPAIVGLVWKLMYNTEYGVFNYFLEPFGIKLVWLGSKLSFISVIITSVWLASSFMTLVTLAGLQNLPVDVFDAAKIDGADNYNIFWHITLPLLKPVIGIAILLQQVACFHVFSTIFIMTGGGPGERTSVLALEIYRKGIESGLVSYAAGVATILVIVALCTSFLFLILMGREFE